MIKSEGIMEIISGFSQKHFDEVMTGELPRQLSRMERELVDIELRDIEKTSRRCHSPFDDDVLQKLNTRLFYIERILDWARRGEKSEEK